MKKNIILLGALMLSSLVYSQVGINNEAPKATLDVTAKTIDGTKPEGIIAPRLTGDQIKLGDAQYNTAQIGTIVYATSAVGGTPAGKTINITSPGYYYFDNTLVWTKFGSGTATAGTGPFNVESTNTPATLNNQNIYQNGNVGIGNFSNTSPIAKLDVRGAVRAGGESFTSGGATLPGTAHVGTVGVNSVAYGYGNEASGMMSFATGFRSKATGIESIAMGDENTASGDSAVAIGFLLTASSRNETVLGSQNAIVTGSNSITWVPTDALLQVGNSNVPGLASNALTILKNGNTAIGIAGTGTAAKPTERLDIGNDNGANLGAGLGGVRIRAINTAAYTGLATDNVVVASSTGVLKTIASASLAVEPWQNQNDATKATSNAAAIYQTGNVSIGSQTPIAPFTSNSVTITPKLSVTGNVATTGSYYTTTGKYADYVFEDYFDGASKIDETYKFRSLEETAAYIKANKHLPGVTSIKDILKTENGYTVNLSELSIQQLEKIEELYLHTIEQQEEISKQKTEINDLKSRMEKLEQLLVKENNNK